MNDLKFAFRQLLKNPGFTAMAVLTLALGCGATITVSNVVHDVILAPPPYPHAQQLVLVSPERAPGQPHSRAWSAGHWAAFYSQARSFDALACYEWAFDFLMLPDGSQSIGGMTVSRDYFKIVGVEPLLGRIFAEEEFRPHSKETTIILSHDLWQRRFNADTNIIGKSVSLGRWPALTVIGVMPVGLRFLPSPQNQQDPSYDVHAQIDYWLPAAPDPSKPKDGSVQVIGRLREGVSVQQALAEVDGIASRDLDAAPDFAGVKISIRQLAAVLNATGERLLLPMVVSVAMVFLIACGNVSGLLLARGVLRQREYAVRSALGAGAIRILRGVLTECLLLAMCGGVGGVALASLLITLLKNVRGHDLPPMNALVLGWPFVWISFGVAVAAAVVAGLLPAVRAVRRCPASALASATRISSADRGERRLLRGMAVLQAVLTLALLYGAGLLVRTGLNLTRVQPGFLTNNILTMNVTLVKGNWFDFHVQALQQIKALPGIVSAAFVWGLPMTGNAWMGAVGASDEPEKPLKDREIISIRAVTPDYFETMGMSIVSGRGVRSSDAGNSTEHIPGDAPAVAVINQALAEACFPGRDPIGKRLRLSWRPDQPEIVGIVSNTRTDDLTQSPRPELYFSMWQAPAWVKHLVVRTKGDPYRLSATVERELRTIEPAVAIEHVETLGDIRRESVALQTFTMRLLVGFACGAGLLALVGLYGVLSFTAGSRRKELAIRSAVGAQRVDILSLILGEGLRLILVGVLLGIGAALALGRLLGSLLFEVKPTDLSTMIWAALAFTIAGLLACWLPARRAARVDPMEALRTE
jgi:putative ABC transport system permease protein